MAFSQFSPNIRMSGALIPANYDDDEFWEDEVTPTIPSLQSLCIHKLIYNSHCLHSIHPIPPKLIKTLLSNAIWNGRVLTINVLMETWPYESLCVGPPVNFINWRFFAKLCTDDLKHLITGVKALFQSFLHPTNQLKYIDLSDIPLRDDEVSFISGIVTDEKLVDLHTRNYVIYLNCIIYSESALLNLRSAISIGKNLSQIKLVIKQLHVAPPNYVSKNALYELLSLLDPHELVSFSYNFFHDCYSLFKSLKHTAIFHHVKVLNLAYSVRFNSEHSFLDEFAHLESLDISGCIVSRHLGNLLKNMYTVKHDCCCAPTKKGLVYLCMQSCNLTQDSILFLARSSLAKSLQNLNIGDNIIDIRSLLELFKACEKLKILELGECKFPEENLRPLFEGLFLLKNLRYLNIAFHILPLELMSYSPLIAEMPSLKYLRISCLYLFDFTNTSLNPKTFVDDLHDSIVAHFDDPLRELQVLS